MNLRKLGNSGLQVSAAGLGCNNFGGRIDLDASRKVIDRALDLGVTLFDTADSYGNRGGSESIIGEVLGTRRKDVVLATKFGWSMDDAGRLKGGSRRYIMQAVEDSLKRLKTDWIDLYQFHLPDPDTPIEETLRALDDLIRQGKVRYIGCSNMASWQLVQAMWTSRANGLSGFISVQSEYNLLEREVERELLPAALAHGVGLLPYYPLAGGLLTGKYRKGAMPEGARLSTTPKLAGKYMVVENWRKLDALERFCASRGRTLLDLAFAWLLSNPLTGSVIAGATRPEQVEANVGAAGWMLSPDDLDELNGLLDAAP
jgi:aryl-alcohol dehydrogenase-like predicted oxidoreductase